MSADLVAFINARLAEDESAATAATRGPWTVFGEGPYGVEQPDGHTVAETQVCQDHEDRQMADAGHIARHDPARVFRELPLKRRLLDEHRPRPIVDPNGDERDDWPERVCGICDPRWIGTPDWEQDEDFVPPEPEHCQYLRMLGSIWPDHPDYREEWRPVG